MLKKKRSLLISTEINIRLFLQYWGYSVLELGYIPYLLLQYLYKEGIWENLTKQ